MSYLALGLIIYIRFTTVDNYNEYYIVDEVQNM